MAVNQVLQLSLEFPRLNGDEQRVLDALAGRRGRARALSAPSLAAMTGLDERYVRDVVKRLVEVHRVPIGSTTSRPPGYYIIAGDEERRQVRASLIRRAVSILQRARAYDRGPWVDQLIGQLQLELERDAAVREVQ